MTNLELAEKLEQAAAEFSPIKYGLLRVIHEVAVELKGRAAEPREDPDPRAVLWKNPDEN